MSDADVTALAEAAGIAPRWRNFQGEEKQVSPDTMLTVLDALGLPGRSEAQVAESRATLAARERDVPPLLTGTVGQPIPFATRGAYKVSLEGGGTVEGQADGYIAALDVPGYHRVECGDTASVLAVAPGRCFSVAEAAPGRRPWALAVQLYALRRPNDGGLGDFKSLSQLAGPAARAGASAIAISPVHAQFSADLNRFSPYSPSSRIGLNVLHAGADLAPSTDARRLENLELIDWPASARLRLEALRTALHVADAQEMASLAAFREREGEALETHATFEALHAHMLARDPGLWHWRDWPEAFRDPANEAVRNFAATHADEVELHAFMQFRADRDLAAAQATAREAGMPIGLIADLAVGADSGGSHCWARQAETLLGLTIGAPPDLLSTEGQSWGLAAFSPRGLRDHGYRAFIEMLRHAMRHAGGVRIDHALGLARLWVVPEGASAAEGAYLSFPLIDMLRLVALESARNQAVVMGEDLGTIPEGFQDRLREAGMMGMRVLWFEKDGDGFTDPRGWTREAAGMTTTHDLPSVAGWWSGRDNEWRRSMGLAGDKEAQAKAVAERETERGQLWHAFTSTGAASGPAPGPADTTPVVDAAVRHLATAACDLVILPVEDALGLVEQPNLPGTTDGHPNWRRRLPATADTMLDPPEVQARLATLNEGRARP